MNFKRIPALLLLLVSLVFPTGQALAAGPSDPIQKGKNAQVILLTTARLPPGQQSSEGMGFLFLVTPTTAANSAFAIRETRDFQLNGASYQAKTEAEMGRRFEPSTQVFPADKFFTDNPPLKPEGIEVPKGAVVVSITMRGTRVDAGAMTGVTLSAGYERQVEDFVFSFAAH